MLLIILLELPAGAWQALATEFEFGEQIEFDFGEQAEFDLDILRQLALCSLRTVQIPTTSKFHPVAGKPLPSHLI